jgi:hypothetical protein
MRAVRIAVITVLACVLVPAAFAGAVQVGGATPFGLAPTPSQQGQPRPYFRFDLGPGQSATDHVVVSNPGTKTAELKISASVGTTAPNSGTAFEGYFQHCSGVACWVSGLPAEMTLPARAQRVVSFTVKVPAGVARQQYLAGITAEPAQLPRPVPITSSTKASANVVIIDQVSLGVAVTVGAVSKMRSQLGIVGVNLGRIGTTWRLYVLVHNGGQKFERANGAAACVLGVGHRKVPIVMNTVLPGGNAALPVNLPRFPGEPSMSCHVRLNYGSGQVATWSGTLATPTSPPTTEVHTGPGEYATLPAGGTPTWAIVVIIVGSLALLACGVVIALLVRRRHQAG